MRKSRALGIALTPKAESASSAARTPGEHGRARRKQDSDCEVRLTEKQRLRAVNIREKRNAPRLYVEAKRVEGRTVRTHRPARDPPGRPRARAVFVRTMAAARRPWCTATSVVDGQRVDRPRTACARSR
ncbi:hypothetical protein QJS66_04070 [Kocuria rhizophila]|nr:hypothetical protein QJS66_04070 [Kocuria rhizophila]